MNTARLRCGYPTNLKQLEQEDPKALQYFHTVGCLGSKNHPEANFKVPGGEEVSGTFRANGSPQL